MKLRIAQIAKIAVTAICLLFGCAWFVVYSSSSLPTHARSVTVVAGPAETYAASCAKCHGADGRAKTAKGKRAGATDFTGPDWNTDEARGIRIITKGKGQMPSFKGKLTEKEITDVFGYVLRFRQ